MLRKVFSYLNEIFVDADVGCVIFGYVYDGDDGLGYTAVALAIAGDGYDVYVDVVVDAAAPVRFAYAFVLYSVPDHADCYYYYDRDGYDDVYAA